MAYRIDDRTAVSLLPAPKTTGTGQPGFFTAGDPQTGEGATVVTDDWLNMVQEELLAVVQAAGIAPDKTNNGQLKAAILSFLQDKLSGTVGLGPDDTAGVGLHLNHGTGRATFGAVGNAWRDLAWGSDVDGLSQRVQEGLQTAVSGTYGMAAGDSAGLGLHTNHTSGKPVYLDAGGSRDLALASDVQGVLSGTVGLGPDDTAGVGLHLNHGTGRATFGAVGNAWRDLAWGSDVDGLSQRVQEGLQTAVSGTYGMATGDSAGLGLHTNHTSGRPVYLDAGGSRDLALASDVQGVLSGTVGLGLDDTAGVGLHLNHGTGRATFGAVGNAWRDLAWGSDVDGLSQRVQEGLQTAVSGTYGMAAGDSAGLGLHTNHTSGKPVYLDAGGSRDLALASDVQGVLSGTVGLAPGDTAGVGLHVNHASDRPTFGDNAGRWRDLALATDLDSRLPVSSPTASGSLTVNNGGATMAINPNTSFNGQLRGQITWGTRAWYPGGDGLIFRDNGNSLVDATKPTSVQRFTTQGSHGQKIPFPQQFKSDDVQVAVLSVDSGGNSFHTVDRFVTDRYGFGLSINSWNGTGYGVEQRQTVIDVLAFGEM